MDKKDIPSMAGLTLKQMMLSKEISPVEVVDAFLERIYQYNLDLSAYISIMDDEARSFACKLEKDIAKGNVDDKPLLGFIVAVDDQIPIQNHPTTLGSLLMEKKKLSYDSHEVEKLKNAGAIILGKTNTSEFGLSSMTMNRLTKPCLNPWDTSFSPGGASGGTGCAIGSGMATAALGNDKGGGLRLPGSFCGIPTLKMTRRLIPIHRPYQIIHTDKTLHQLGIMSRHTKDINAILNAITPQDKTFNILEEVKPLKIAWSPDLDFILPDKKIVDAIKKTLEQLQNLGHHVEEIKIGLTQDIITHYCNLLATNIYIPIVSLFNDDREKYEELTEYTRYWLEYGRKVSGIEYSIAMTYKDWLYNTVNDIFNNFDLLVTPTTPMLPFPVNMPPPEIRQNNVMSLLLPWSYTLLFNMTGHPACSIPCAFTENNLPIGMQMIGKYFAEETLLSVANQLENVLGIVNQQPSLTTKANQL